MVLDVLREVLEIFKKPLQFIADRIDDLGEIIEGFWEKLGLSTETGVVRAWDTIYSDVEWLADTVSSGIENILSDIDSQLETASSEVSSSIDDAFNLLTDNLWDVGDNVSSSMLSTGEMIRDVLDKIGEGITEIPDRVEDALSDAWDTITGVPEKFKEVFKDVIGWTFEGFTDLMDKAIEGSLEDLQMLIADAELGLGGLPSEVTVATSMAGPSQFHQFMELVEYMISLPGRLLFEALRTFLEYEPPATPEKARNAVGRFIEVVLTFTTLPMLMSKLPDMFEPFKNWGFDRILQNMYWSLGLGWLTWLIFGEPFRVIITEPIQEYYRAKYKTAPTPRSLLDEAFRKWVLPEMFYRQRLSEMGFKDHDIELFVRTAFNPATDTALRHGLETGMITEKEALEILKMKGYDLKSIKLELQQLVDAALGKERDFTYSQVTRLYRLGLITRERAIQMLTDIGYSVDKATVLVDLTDAEQQLELTELRVKVILEDLRDGVVTREQAISELVRLGVTRERAETLVDLQLARQRTEPREKITKSDIRQLYQAGKISREQAVHFLETLGYSATIAEMLVDLWDTDQALESRDLTKSEILRLYSYGLISREQAISMLEAIGYNRDAAELLVKLQEYKEKRELEELKIRSILEDLRDGYLTASEAVEKLVETGVTRERAQLLVELELARTRVTRRREASLSQIHEFWRYGLIDDSTAVAWLEGIGYKHEVAEMFLTLWKMQLEPDQREATRSMIIQAFRYGLLDYQQALNMLKEIGYSEDAARLVLDIEVAREYSDLRNEEAENILLAFRYGLISEDEARQQLVELGLHPARVEVLLDREKIRRARPREPRRVTASQVLRAYQRGIIPADVAEQWLIELGYTVEKDRKLLLALYSP